MGAFAPRSPTSDRATEGARGGPSPHRHEPLRPAAAAAPAQRAAEEIAAIEHHTAAAKEEIERLREAHAANDVARWTETRARLDGALREAERALPRARAAADGSGALAGRLATAEGEIEASAIAARALTAPPSGIVRVPREAELEAVLAAPIAGSAAAGYQQKEAAVRAELDRLSPAESRVLADRLRRPRPSDALAALFGRMTADRRGRLLAYLDDARRREALRVARAPRPAAPASTSALASAPASASASASSSSSALAPASSSSSPFASSPASGPAPAPALPSTSSPALAPAASQVLASARALASAPALASSSALTSGPAPAPTAALVSAPALALASAATLAMAPAQALTSAAALASSARGGAKEGPLGRVLEEVRHTFREDTAAAYVRTHQGALVAAMAQRVGTLAPPAHPRLAWLPGGPAAAFTDALWTALGAAALEVRLPELLHPTDPWYVIDQHRALTAGTPGHIVDGRAPLGPLTWTPLAADALAIEVAGRLRESLARMAPRYAAQLDAKHPALVAAGDLVTSHPMDLVAARLLCDARTVRPVARAPGESPAPSSDPALFSGGLRPLETWRWLGERDPRLWNWIEVQCPADARAEEVAAALLHRPGESAPAPASHLAYRITAAPPFFGLEPKLARELLGRAAPPEVQSTPDAQSARNAQAYPGGALSLALAESALANEAAIAQAADERAVDKRGVPLPPDLERLATQLEHSQRRIERAKKLLIPWRLWTLVLPALDWIARHREHLAALPEERLANLAPAIEGQQELLYHALGSVQQLAPLQRRGSVPVNAPGARPEGAANETDIDIDADTGPVADVLRRYAVAIGTSFLIDTARTHLAAADEARAGLTFAAMDRALLESRGSVADQQPGEDATAGQAGAGAAAAVTHAALRRHALELRGRVVAGAELEPGELELSTAMLNEHALRTHVHALYYQLRALSAAAAELVPAAFDVYSGQIVSPVRIDGAVLSAMAGDLDATVLRPWAARKQHRTEELGGARDRRTEAQAMNRAAADTQLALEGFVKRHNLPDFVRRATQAIEHRQRATAAKVALVQIAALLGLGFVGSILGNMAAGAVRGVLLSRTAVTTAQITRNVRTARILGGLTSRGVDSAVNATGQTLITGKGGPAAWLENFVVSGAVLNVLRPLHAALATWGGAQVASKTMSLWERVGGTGKLVLRAGVELTAEALTGAGVSYALHRALGKPPDERTAATWAIEGASMAIGRFAASTFRDLERRLVALAEHGAHLRMRAASARRVSEQAAQVPDKNQSMELLAERHKQLTEEAELLERADRIPGLKLTPETLATLRAGNRAERVAVEAKAYAMMPLRLAGLAPDDASEKVWTGTTEDIAIALHQASRSGLEVKVLDHDRGARTWRVLYGGEELTIVETRLSGQPRAAKPEPTGADRTHAHRYAEAAAFMQAQWETRTKAEIDARAVIDFDHLQIGHSIAGVMNQATLPATGDGLGRKLVVYDHGGTLTGRGAQDLGQDPRKWDAPGIRGSEQAAAGAAWITSEDHKRSLDIGRLEVQTPAYRGAVVKLERRPAGAPPAGADPWMAPHRELRILVRDAAGAARWFYTDRLDNAGGMGPADLKHVRNVTEPAQLEEMLARGQILRGEDPAYASKVRAGEIFVWGGTPTGAWAAEPAAHPPGTRTTIIGDTRPPKQDWPQLLENYQAVMAAIAARSGDDIPADLAQRKQDIEKQIGAAHGGMALRRNTKPGATYEHGVQPGAASRVQVEFGTPSRISSAPDGRVLVTIGTGADAKTRLYDQVVVAHGQDPGAPGAPGALLGPGATQVGEPATDGAKTYGEVPAGTIALRPVLDPRTGDLLELESVEPAGKIRLRGAAYATKRLSPWVVASERAKFEAALAHMEAVHAPTRDHGPVSTDSTKVTTGIEHQRDRIPRANEALAAKAYRLPGPDQTLELDPANPARWDEQVREFFTVQLRANGQWVKVKRLEEGRSQAIVYRVWVDAHEVGVFKLFDGREGAAHEQEMLKRLDAAKLTKMKAVKERGRMAVDPQTGFGGGALLMDAAPGTSIKQLIEHLPRDPAKRRAELEKLTAAMRRAAEGLAEMHAKFETKGAGGKPVMMSKEAKLSDANHLLDNNFRNGQDVAKVKAALGEADFLRVKAALEGPMLRAFLDADVPATAYHGDANAGNFIVNDYNSETGFKELGVIDVSAMRWSVDMQTGKGTKTGAADVARLLGSLETLRPGELTTTELGTLRSEFMRAYSGQYAKQTGRAANTRAYGQAVNWYRIEMEVSILKSDASAKSRILQLLEIGVML